MQRLLDKWGLWIALVAVGSVIVYGLVTAYMRESVDPGKGAKPAATKSFN